MPAIAVAAPAILDFLPLMTPELDTLLCQRHPRIFRLRHSDPQLSALGRGMECGDGWFRLIDTLCEQLQWETDHNDAPQVVATQVKEKMGTLRFHARPRSDYQSGMIRIAEALSAHLCERCGKFGEMLIIRGYRSVRCDEHLPPGP
ncbi:hypothetical protein [Oryzisolibacter propanilivorax]|nr:hypothetical protein [Oryzisolibacter propanilivorax]